MTAVRFPCNCVVCMEFRFAMERDRLRAEEYKSDLHNGNYAEDDV